MNKQQVQDWKEIREKGTLRFVLLRGVLGWGLFMFAIMTFRVHKIRLEETGKILGSFGVWMIGGALFGVLTWKFSERSYRKSLKDQ